MPLREALRIGGWTTVITIGLAGAIVGGRQRRLGGAQPGHPGDARGQRCGDGRHRRRRRRALPARLGAASARLADRLPRTRVAAVSSLLWSVLVALTGMVQNAFSLFMARLGSGLAQSYELPVNGPVLIDTYPIEARGRVFGLVLLVPARGVHRRSRCSPAASPSWSAAPEAGAGRSSLIAARWPCPWPSRWPDFPSPAGAVTRCRRCWARSSTTGTSSRSPSASPSSACGRSSTFYFFLARHGQPRPRPVQPPAVPQPVPARTSSGSTRSSGACSRRPPTIPAVVAIAVVGRRQRPPVPRAARRAQ